MTTKKTVLIFGISSFLGSNLAEQLKEDYRVVGTYYSTPVDIPGVLSIKCDVHDKDIVQKVVFLFKPDITVYAVGLKDINACQKFPKVADALNTAGVFNVSAASERYKSKFIYFSTCFIFSGEDTLFKENDTPMPSSVYGNTVASAEFYIQKSCLNYLIFRCAPIMGRSYNPFDMTWLETVERLNYKGEKIICDTKINHGYIDIWSVVEIFKQAMDQNITNRLFQISSKDLANRYVFTKKYLEKSGGDTSLLSKGDWHFPRTENRLALQNIGDELNFSMDTENVEATFNIEMPTFEEVINTIYEKSVGKRSTKNAIKSANVTFI
ncbi:MAG: sugar nucleotide-binding protein [Bacteriovoracaceae bacterium]|nr:sugar nucleotide-binding protein [Bacteriovoracaceae bacterium]